MGDPLVTLSGPTMGTRFTVRAAASPGLAGELTVHLQAAVDRVDAQMSTWKPDSPLSRFNRSPIGEWFELEPQMAEVIRIGLEIGARSGGAFDMTLGELVDLWGFGPAGRTGAPPPAKRIEAVLQPCGHNNLELDGTAVRKLSALALDLSGIAKGFGVDELARVLLTNGIGNFVAEIDGEVRICGTRPDGSDWRVAIALPVPLLSAAYGALSPGPMAVATSGDYRHFFRSGGRHYSHTIDGRTGYPVDGVASATVLDPQSCARADATASALMVMGWDEACRWCEATGVAAILLRRAESRIDLKVLGPVTVERAFDDAEDRSNPR